MTDSEPWAVGFSYSLPSVGHVGAKADSSFLTDLMFLLRADLAPDPEDPSPSESLSESAAAALDDMMACPDLYLAQLRSRSDAPKEWTVRSSDDGAMAAWYLGPDVVLAFRYPIPRTHAASGTGLHAVARHHAPSATEGTTLWLVGGVQEADTSAWVPGAQQFPKGRAFFTSIAPADGLCGKEDLPAIHAWLRWSAVVRAWGSALDSLKTKRRELESLTGWLRQGAEDDREAKAGAEPTRRSFADMRAHVRFLEASDSLLDACYSLLVDIDRLKRTVSWPADVGAGVVRVFGQEIHLTQHFADDCARYDALTEDIRSSLELAKLRREQEAKHHEYAEKVLEITERYVRIRQAGVLASIVSLFMMLTLAVTIDSVNKAISAWKLPLSFCGSSTLWVFLLTLVVPLFGEGQLDRWKPMDYVLWGLFCVSCGLLMWNCLAVWCSCPWIAAAPLGLVSGLAVFVSVGPIRGLLRGLLRGARNGKRKA